MNDQIIRDDKWCSEFQGFIHFANVTHTSQLIKVYQHHLMLMYTNLSCSVADETPQNSEHWNEEEEDLSASLPSAEGGFNG